MLAMLARYGPTCISHGLGRSPPRLRLPSRSRQVTQKAETEGEKGGLETSGKRMETRNSKLSKEISVWDSKPAWCQPWTILLTGSLLVGGAFKISGDNVFVGALVGVPVVAWWYIFLVEYPAMYKEAMERGIDITKDI